MMLWTVLLLAFVGMTECAVRPRCRDAVPHPRQYAEPAGVTNNGDYHAEAHYKCATGYAHHATGDYTVRCFDGVWTGTPLSCKVSPISHPYRHPQPQQHPDPQSHPHYMLCGAPPQPGHNAQIKSTRNLGEKEAFAVYECISGYWKGGQFNMQCNNGVWNGKPLSCTSD